MINKTYIGCYASYAEPFETVPNGNCLCTYCMMMLLESAALKISLLAVANLRVQNESNDVVEDTDATGAATGRVNRHYIMSHVKR